MIAGNDNALYIGEVRHARYRPRTHRFTYRVFSAFLNVDDIDNNRLGLKLLSVDRFNLFSIRRRDHGPKDGAPLRPFIESLLAEAGLQAPEAIHILCYPRMFGFAFNPLTVYYCRSHGKVTAMVYEVRNTFGDDHIYVVPLNGANADRPLLHNRDKLMHVSFYRHASDISLFRTAGRDIAAGYSRNTRRSAAACGQLCGHASPSPMPPL